MNQTVTPFKTPISLPESPQSSLSRANIVDVAFIYNLAVILSDLLGIAYSVLVMVRV